MDKLAAPSRSSKQEEVLGAEQPHRRTTATETTIPRTTPPDGAGRAKEVLYEHPEEITRATVERREIHRSAVSTNEHQLRSSRDATYRNSVAARRRSALKIQRAETIRPTSNTKENTNRQ